MTSSRSEGGIPHSPKPDNPLVYTEGAAGPEQTFYLHHEALGSVGLVTDNQGGETERTYFDPFGDLANTIANFDVRRWLE